MKKVLGCADNGIVIHDIVYNLIDKVKWSMNSGRMNTSMIRYDHWHPDYPNDSVPYFEAYGCRIYFHNVLGQHC